MDDTMIFECEAGTLVYDGRTIEFIDGRGERREVDPAALVEMLEGLRQRTN